MNYFQFHVGDYVASTAHLSWDEDMAYTRLIRAYYQTEKPIPKDKAYRLARATTPAQKSAVDSVLDEFFVLLNDGYHQKRCDEEIVKFSDKQLKAKRSANARWKSTDSHSEGNANASEPHMRTHSEGNANASEPHMRTHSEGNANQEPITNNQEPITKEDNNTGIPPSRAGAVCVVVKSVGLNGVNPQHPKLLALLDDGAQVQEFEDAARKAVDAGKGFAYALGIVKNTREDAKRTQKTQPQPESFKERDDRKARERWEQMTGQTHPDSLPKQPSNVIDVTPFVSVSNPAFLEISQ